MSATIKIILQAVNNASEEIDKADSSIDRMLGTVGKITAAAAIMGKTFKEAYDMTKEGASIHQTAESFDALIERVETHNDVLGDMQKATNHTVSALTLQKGALTLTAGATGEYEKALVAVLPNLAEYAKAANKINPLLGDTERLFDKVTLAAKRQSLMIADDLGMTIKMESAIKELHPAMQGLAGSYDELTSQQKFLNEMLFQGDRLVQQAGGSVDSYGDSLYRLEGFIQDQTNAAKQWLAEGLMPIVDGYYAMKDAQQEVVDEMRGKLNPTYDDYTRLLVAQAIVDGELAENSRYHMESILNTGTAAQGTMKQLNAMTRETWDAAQAAAESDSIFQNYARAIDEAGAASQSAEIEFYSLAVAEEDAKKELGALSTLMSQDLSASFDKTKKNHDELTTKAGELRAQIDELEASWKANTDAGKEELGKLKSELAETEEAISELEKAWDRQTGKMIFDLAMQVAAVDGYTQAELQALGRLAGPDGLDMIDEAFAGVIGRVGEWDALLADGSSVDAANAHLLDLHASVSDTTQTVDDMTMAVDDLGRSIHGLPTNKEIRIALNYVTTGSAKSVSTYSAAEHLFVDDRPAETSSGVIKVVPTSKVEAYKRANGIGHADGGDTVPGELYVVGERGPEPWIPTAPGQVVSNENARQIFGGRDDEIIRELKSLSAKQLSAQDIADAVLHGVLTR